MVVIFLELEEKVEDRKLEFEKTSLFIHIDKNRIKYKISEIYLLICAIGHGITEVDDRNNRID